MQHLEKRPVTAVQNHCKGICTHCQKLSMTQLTYTYCTLKRVRHCSSNLRYCFSNTLSRTTLRLVYAICSYCKDKSLSGTRTSFCKKEAVRNHIDLPQKPTYMDVNYLNQTVLRPDRLHHSYFITLKVTKGIYNSLSWSTGLNKLHISRN